MGKGLEMGKLFFGRSLMVCQLINCGLGGTGVSPVQPREHGQDARATHKKELDKPWGLDQPLGDPHIRGNGPPEPGAN